MKKALLTLSIVAATTSVAFSAAIVVPDGSTVLASWSFDGVTTTNTGTSASAGLADIGALTAGSSATALHTSAATVYSNPAGNGSAKSFSSNNWAIGDYYQFVVATTGFSNINVTFGHFGSGTGPKDFKLSYSTDGTNFSDFGSYAVLGTPSWSATASSFRTEQILAFDLSAITALNNIAAVTFRLVDTSTTSVNNATVASGGTSRVDDFTVSSGPVTLTSSVPEPTALVSLLGGVGMLMGFRRLRGSARNLSRSPRHPTVVR